MPPAANTPPPPGAAGMATPQKKAGDEGAARTNIQISMNMLEQALPVFGSESDEGKVILKALTGLANAFGKDKERDLVPAQIMQLLKAEPSLGGGAMQKAMQPQGGGAPGGQPPPMMGG
jgi:hypothetical protein